MNIIVQRRKSNKLIILKFYFFGRKWPKYMEKCFQEVEFLVSEDDLHIEWQTGSNLSSVTLFL